MVSMPSDNLICVRLEQNAKGMYPMLLTLPGIVTSVSAHVINASLPILVTPSPITTSVIDAA